MKEEIILTQLLNTTVSVIIPFYMHREWLVEAILSIERQTLLPSEVIIIDDGSAEDISDIASIYFEIIIIHQDNHGAAFARNQGIAKAKGEYVAFLDSDDIWFEKKLEKQLYAMMNSNCNWSFSNYQTFANTSLKILHNSGIYDESEVLSIYPYILISCRIATPTVIVKHSCFNDSNIRFNEKLQVGEDVCLWLDLAKRYKVLVLNEPLAAVRMHGHNAAKSIRNILHARRDIWTYIQENESLQKNLIPRCISIPYQMCNFGCRVFDYMNKKGLIKSDSRVVGGIIYFLPWLIFRVDSVLYKDAFYTRRNFYAN